MHWYSMTGLHQYHAPASASLEDKSITETTQKVKNSRPRDEDSPPCELSGDLDDQMDVLFQVFFVFPVDWKEGLALASLPACKVATLQV